MHQCTISRTHRETQITRCVVTWNRDKNWLTSQRQEYSKITDPEQILGNQDTNAQPVLSRFLI